MPADLQKLGETKENILSLIRTKGPSLPVQIASNVKMSPLFTSAFLSELFAEKKIKMSNMRVGSSPLYFIAGQEALLDDFVGFLNAKEKEAFFLLKEKKIMEDSALSPSIRVAMKEIKDFAIPIRIRINNEVKLFWKYHQTGDEEVKQIIQPISISSPVQAPILPQSQSIKPIESKPSPIPEEKAYSTESAPQDVLPKKKTKSIGSEFAKNLKEYLTAKDIEILESIIEKKKEFAAKIRIDTLFGKQEYYLIAKDKKTVNESDLSSLLQKAQAEKMPALFMCRGELHKKARPYIKDWRNLIKFERFNF